jgi:O-antigen ligase/Flp pilus assembly protein TadD
MNTSTETIFRRIILVSIFIVPFLAFLVSSSLFFPFITGKNFAFRMLAEVMFFAWVPLAYYRTEYRPKFSWIMAALVSFVGIVLVADIFGANPYRSFWSNYERMEGFVGLIHLFGYFIVAGSVLTTEKLWTRFFHTIILTSVLMIFYGMCQLSGSESCPINQSSSRLDGTFGNAAYLAIYMLFSIAFTALLLVRHKGDMMVKWIYGVIIFFQMIILYYTGTRGVILGFAVGVVFSSVLTLMLVKKNRLVRNFSLGIIGALILVVASLGAVRDAAFVKENPVLDRIASFSIKEALNNPRFMVWGMAVDGFKERPILGWGQENFNLVFNKYYDPGMYTQEQWFDRAHNIFFDWLTAGGILALLGYLSLFLAAFVLIWKNEDNTTTGETRFARFKNTFKSYFAGERAQKAIEASILSGLLVAYFVNNIFVFDNLFSYLLFFSLLAYLHHLHTARHSVEKKTRKALEKELPFVVVGVPVFFLFLAVFYFINMRPLYANQALIDAIRPHAANTFTKENLQGFKDAINYNTFGNSETREQILQAAMQVKDSSVDGKLKQETFDFAKEQILAQIQDAPNDARYEMFAGILFFRYGMNDEALTHFEQAHKLSPKKQTLDFNLILAYLNVKKIDEAYTLAKEAYELDPLFQEAAKYYAIASLYKGDEPFANDLLTKTYSTDLYYDETLINVYAQLGKFDKVTAILQKKLSDGGDDPQLRLRLAAAYLEMGKKTESLAEIQKIIDAHPDFKQQGEYYMGQIRAGKKP